MSLDQEILREELEQLIETSESTPPQVSVHILSARKLSGMSLRFFQLEVDSLRVQSKKLTTRDSSLIINESFLLPVSSYKAALTVSMHSSDSLGETVEGGLVLKLEGFKDQKRHDGWYDMDCGEVRLAIRLLYDLKVFYQQLLNALPEQNHASSFVVKLKNKDFPLQINKENRAKEPVYMDELFADVQDNQSLENQNSELNQLSVDEIEEIRDELYEDIEEIKENNIDFKEFSRMLVKKVGMFLLQKSIIRNDAAEVIQRGYRNFKEDSTTKIERQRASRACINYIIEIIELREKQNNLEIEEKMRKRREVLDRKRQPKKLETYPSKASLLSEMSEDSVASKTYRRRQPTKK